LHSAYLRTWLPVSVLVWCSTAALPAAAQNGRPEIGAYRLSDDESIVVDGAMDEGAWQKAAPATNFLQRDPDNGDAATERTEVRIVYDGERIILGVICHDSEPHRLLGNQMQRDQSFEADDRFMFAIDPFYDGRTGYFFEINPSGAMGDGLITGPTGGDDFGGEMEKSWDGIWLARVRKTDIGWTAEIEIPFKTVNFNPDTDTWGANFQRTVKRKNEESLWTGWLRDEGLTRMSNAGRINGINGISQGIGLDLRPYVLGAGASAPGRGRPATTGDFDIGIDGFYNLTPALKANFTINTDFAETEVDERRTNLTRFPLFFEEKREFFLDGSNFFEFTGDENPFYSRRIGLNEGVPQPILYGGKLIGQAGAFDVGVLQVSTSNDEVPIGDEPTELKGEDFTVARLKRRFGTQSSMGMLYTRRSTRDSAIDVRQTAGADLVLATPNLAGTDITFNSGTWFVYTSKPNYVNEELAMPPDGSTNAFGGYAFLSKDPFDGGMSFKEVQPAYDAAVGFTRRRNFRAWNPEFSWAPRFSGHPWFRGVDFEVEADINTSLDNALIDRNIQFTPLELEFHSGDTLTFQLFKQTEHLDEDFEIEDGIILPAGNRYDWWRYQVQADTAEHRVLSGRVEMSFGDFWDGDRRELNLDVTLRPRPGLSLHLSSEFNDVNLPGGDFVTEVYRLDARTQFSPWISLENNIQYDSESSEMGWQLRFRWIQKPGNDFYFIWTENWQQDPGAGFTALDRRGVAKVVRTIRF
jgi:hypothetical protein